MPLPSAAPPLSVVSATDLMPPDWRFLAPHCDDPGFAWITHSGLRRNALERRVKRPHLGRWRAAWTAVAEARDLPRAVLVSHLPHIAGVTNVLRRRRCPDVPQIAFAFNYTDLPTGARRRAMARALDGIAEFVVFSRYETALYPAHFDLDPARFTFLPWAMEPPVPGAHNPVRFTEPYLCAIGGEGRDYRLLAEVMAGLPQVRMAIVARPYSVAGIAFPDNVEVFTNLALDRTWRLAADSRGMVVPLVSDRTACGHITLVGAQQLGIPLLVTRSRGVADYVTDGVTARLCEAGDAAELRAGIAELAAAAPSVAARARAARDKTLRENDLAEWVAYFRRWKARDGTSAAD